MRAFYLFGLLFIAPLVGGCRQVPPLPPPDGDGTCESARANLTKLGGCGLDMAMFAAECEGASTAEANIGVRLPLGCLTNSASCESAGACR